MFEIDKEKFGGFVAQLRKEKGLMQKDLAEKLYVSDKAVSKWERGLSIPDVALLVPLGEILGVTVTELLECRRLLEDAPMDTRQTEEIVKKVIGLSEEEQRKYRPDRLKRGLQLLLCAIIGALEVWALTLLGYSAEELMLALFTVMLLMVLFGVYFCVFTKEKLPRYYDENRISAFSDGVMRMNIPGVCFNNRNWPHIVRAGQLWAMIGLIASPAVYFVLTRFLPEVWESASVYITLILVLGGLFVPMIVVARKYEYAPENPRPSRDKGRAWLWIGACVLAMIIIFAIISSGITASGSGLRVGWVESSGRDHWSAAYALHDSYKQRTVNADGAPTVIRAEIVSTSGDIGMIVTDMEGNIVFSREKIETSSFAIEITDKVTVKISGDEHKGSFFLSW